MFMKKSTFPVLLFWLLAAALPGQNAIPYGNNPAAGQFVEVNGIKMYYEIYGEGQPLLLLHGNGGSIGSRSREIPQFASHYRVIAVDSRCHGKSGCATAELTYEQMAADVDALLDRLGVDSCYVWGHSDGGILALLMGIHYPDKVSRMLVTGANLQPDTTAVFPELVALVGEFRQQPDTMLRKHMTLVAEHPHIEFSALRNVSAPVLVMAGDRDAIREEHTVRIYQSLPNAQLCILPGTTHFVSREQPALFMQIALNFFEKPFQKPSTVAIMRQMAEQMKARPEKKN